MSWKRSEKLMETIKVGDVAEESGARANGSAALQQLSSYWCVLWISCVMCEQTV
jgi:hypothetical protein